MVLVVLDLSFEICTRVLEEIVQLASWPGGGIELSGHVKTEAAAILTDGILAGYYHFVYKITNVLKLQGPSHARN